ncbi:MAG: gamma-glutamyl-gamma-aminobutyraldehyde dehydrogenase [Woeseiaceae bacterium]|jgi:gamma-glutamyl-gamma-aminobutyraldehyde dehydrogenase|tara:strand:+ start:21870 stop:23357 length:1488 start_codon:yes stop_codon:yes gene_type:complete
MIKQEDINTLRNKKIETQSLFIGNKQIPAQSEETIEVTSPIDGKFLTTIANANENDVDIAVTTARKSFESGSWSKAAPQERKKILNKFAELIEKNTIELAVLGVRDNGTEINMAIMAEPSSAAGCIRYYAETIDKMYGEIAPTSENILGLIHREPIGVIGAIIPWNFPLMIASWKFAPALSAGNSVVIKPAESASLSLLRIAELAAEAGIPDGVFNVITGDGEITGKALAMHMDVDVIAFTGSGVVGRKILEYSARSNLKRVYLELGGKSPNIVFADTQDIDKAVTQSLGGIFRNSGQVCVAGSRLIIEEAIADEFTDKLINESKKLIVGDPLDITSNIGAIASQDQLTKNLSYVKSAMAEGALLKSGGKQINQELGGFYMEPTVFSNINSDMQIAQEEVFGPVLSILTCKDEAEAVKIANATVYGLAAAVWTADLSKAHRMVRSIRAGVVHVNCYGGADLTVPLGGVKQSGNGHDRSLHAIEKYTDLKTAWISL